MAITAATFAAIIAGVNVAGQVVMTVQQLIEIAKNEPTDDQLAQLEAKNAELDSRWDSLKPDSEREV